MELSTLKQANIRYTNQLGVHEFYIAIFLLQPIVSNSIPCMNSSYNVSTSTLRVMTEQFQFGNRICEAIELNKAHWPALFEPYMFFESYRNYLQVDIVAANTDDLRSWKGWVESRLRQLTLKIERDTLGKLQCHPCPHEYSDPSKQCSHNAFFMGLQRKQGKWFKKVNSLTSVVPLMSLGIWLCFNVVKPKVEVEMVLNSRTQAADLEQKTVTRLGVTSTA